jgi:Zn-dependent M28 family amino/carboxypeptidase
MLPVIILGGIGCLLTFAWAALTQPVLGRRAAACHPRQVEPERLEAHVRMLSETFHPRGWENLENLERVAGYIAAEFKAAGGDVSGQPYKTSFGETHRNVIAQFGPDTPERIIVGAHYDAVDEQPGADDNASGVAGLIELAHLLGESPPPLRVELVAWTLEEPPIFPTSDMGSARHASALRKANVNVRAAISLEMLGTFLDDPGTQSFPAPILRFVYPSTGNFITVVGKLGEGELVRTVKAAMRGATDLPVESINAPRWVPGIDFSDHANYWDQGYPAAMITDTAFYRNPRYHTARDTADTLDYERMAKVVQGVYCAVHALSQPR